MMWQFISDENVRTRKALEKRHISLKEAVAQGFQVTGFGDKPAEHLHVTWEGEGIRRVESDVQ